MLLANETVGGASRQQGVPALYRVHEAPDPVKVEEFEESSRTLG